ncbi:MAG: GtrA family protein [Candidatus Staskawiczbacteria bacterium]|nr:GtrA family protein [Candidatus Staskawiczbacteria bacterium]
MKKNDIIFAIISGLSVAWVCDDFLAKYNLRRYSLVLLFALPVLAVLGLWLADIIGRKQLFVRQVGKFALAGAAADVVDIKVFQLLFQLTNFSLISKSISFLAATFLKFWWNKYWGFEKPQKDGIKKEITQFFLITVVGLAINLISFNYFTAITGPQFSMTPDIWRESSTIFAALIASVWNFLGYKFIVFKK